MKRTFQNDCLQSARMIDRTEKIFDACGAAILSPILKLALERSVKNKNRVHKRIKINFLNQ